MRGFSVVVATVTLLLVVTGPLPDAAATPRMSATSGAPCTTCHYNPDGGGIRSSIGFGNQIHNAAVDYEKLGLGFMSPLDTNFLNDWLAVGFDGRIQMARLGEPRLESSQSSGQLDTAMPERRIFPMQIQPRLAVFPSDWLTVLGSYALGPGIGEGELCSGAYRGQMCGEAQAIIDLDPAWPTIRAGMFRPNIGIRHDDHTKLIEVDATRTRPAVIPPNYAEAGIEANYQPRYWFRATAGAYRSDQLAASLDDPEMTRPGDPAGLARLTFYPQFDAFDQSFYGWAGASTFASGHLRGTGSFRMDKAFAGLGMLDRGSWTVDVAHLDFRGADTRRGFNASTTLSIELLDWLVAQGRLEQALTWREAGDATTYRRSAVGGLQLYPVPFIKFQPEYRLTETNEWVMGQYALQMHVHY